MITRYTVLVLLVGDRKRKIRFYLSGVRATYLLIYYSLHTVLYLGVGRAD